MKTWREEIERVQRLGERRYEEMHRARREADERVAALVRLSRTNAGVNLQSIIEQIYRRKTCRRGP